MQLDPFNTRPLASGNVALLDTTGRLVLEIVTPAALSAMQDDDIERNAEQAMFDGAAEAEAAAERYWEDRGNDAGSHEDRYERWLESLAS